MPAKKTKKKKSVKKVYKKSTDNESELMEYSTNRAAMSEESLLKLANGYLREARLSGVTFEVKYNDKSNLYRVSVKGESGYVFVSLRRLPAMIHGLFTQGPNVRELFWLMHEGKDF